MAHLHTVTDSDKHFVINAITREIKNISTSKTTVIQFDHNSERFTFEVPRFIEGHDMLQCNKVEVHYLNIDSATKESKEGIYLVDDLQESPEDENTLLCTWLISQNATTLIGSLNFILRFACINDDNVDYVWNTAINSSIYVSKGIFNQEIVAEQYLDLIKEWEERLLSVENSIGSSGISPTAKVTPIDGGYKVTITDAQGVKTFNIMNGTNGKDGKDGTNGLNGLDGADGVSPTTLVEEISGGHRVSITDVNGAQSFDVMDGKDGESGGITEESDPTVPEWAKKPTKPTYTANEVGAVTESEVLELINTQLGVIENGTY